MNTCLTCKYWEKLDERSAELSEIGRCKAVVDYWYATKWIDEDECDKRVLKKQYTNKLAFTNSASDYAELYTFPAFGCMQYKPNPIENQN